MKRLATYLLLILSLSQCRKETEPAPEPLAAFFVQNNNCTAPCEVVFTNASKDATSYRWDFADGQSSSEPSPKHTYTVAGSYIVKLTAKGGGGSNDVTQTVTIKARPAAAVAQFTIAGGGCTAPCAVTLTNQSQNATTYQWDFGDGQTSTEQNPQHTYTQGKTYTIKLIAMGLEGSSMLNKEVSIQAPPPLADFTFTGGDCTAPCEVIFTNKSTNADSYQWDFGDRDSSTQVSPRHLYTKGGTFQVVLTATGSGKTATKTLSVTIKAPPLADFTFTGGDCTAPCEVVFTNKSTNADSYQWDFGDGGSSTEASPRYQYTIGGTFQVVLTAIRNGKTATITQSVVIKVHIVTKIWDKVLGGSKFDNLSSIVATSDGGFLLGGTSYSPASGDKTEDSRGDIDYSDYWVVKINANGVKQWDKTLGGSSNDYLSSVVATADGGFLLGGSSDSPASGDKSEAKKGGGDYWVVKINANGVKQWDKTLGGSSSNDNLTSVIAAADGGFLLGGTSGASLSPASGDKTENSRGGDDYWVVKINANGVKQWDKTFGGSKFDNLSSIAATSDGGFLLGGSSDSPASGDKSEYSRNGFEYRDYWVVKINANGVKQWDKTLGGVVNDFLTSVIAMADGGFLLGGYSYSPASADKTAERKGNNDYWLIKINSNGGKQWDKALGGANDDNLSSVVATSDGGFLLGGTSGASYSPASGDKTENSRGGGDYWVVKINANGVKQWDKTLGGSSDDYSSSVVATSDGGFLVGGSSDSPGSADKTENSKGSRDFWVIKIK